MSLQENSIISLFKLEASPQHEYSIDIQLQLLYIKQDKTHKSIYTAPLCDLYTKYNGFIFNIKDNELPPKENA